MAEKIYRAPEASTSGGYVFPEELVQAQRKFVMQFLKKIGMNLLEIKDVIRTSLPVQIFEPKSYLQRLVEGFMFAPVLLQKAAQSTDPVERLKLVMVTMVSGLMMTCKQEKPFNPILGETYQAVAQNGTEVFCEQVSHHPPVSAWEFVGPNKSFHFYGRGAWVASFRGNSVKGQQMGNITVEFQDGTAIHFTPLPEVWISGILMGERKMEYLGKTTFTYPAFGLSCELSFNPDSGLIKWMRGKSTPSDYVRGEIVKDEGGQRNKVCTVQGSWVGCLDFDDTRYWDSRTMGPAQRVDPTPLPQDAVLSSDCRFREDLIYLLQGDLEKSSEWKAILEDRQRHDAKLRKESGKRRHHHH